MQFLKFFTPSIFSDTRISSERRQGTGTRVFLSVSAACSRAAFKSNVVIKVPVSAGGVKHTGLLAGKEGSFLADLPCFCFLFEKHRLPEHTR